jgi:thioredoxin 1
MPVVEGNFRMSTLTAVTDADFEAEVLQSPIPVLVDLWAEWCAPCRMVAPVVEQIANETEGVLKVVKVDVDSNPGVPRQYGVLNLPTLLLFKDGEEVKRSVGFKNKPQLLKLIAEHVEGVGAAR